MSKSIHVITSADKREDSGTERQNILTFLNVGK